MSVSCVKLDKPLFSTYYLCISLKKLVFRKLVLRVSEIN